MLTEKHEMKKAKQFQKFVPGAQDGQAALEVMNQRYGGNASGVLLGNKGGVSERDKVSSSQQSCRLIVMHKCRIYN